MRVLWAFVWCLCLALVAGTAEEPTDQLEEVEDEAQDDFYDNREHALQQSYHGLIKENETFVEITPLIKVDSSKVCGFQILKRQREIPFQIELQNGIGVLKAKRQLNCEKRKNYKFDIVAVFCDGAHSKSASVHISVIDINEYSPTFLSPSYVTEVDEGRLYEEILRVEATDKDCTPLFGDVCKYEIVTSDQPFAIDNEGVVSNTEPLSHLKSHNHILSVVAFDCAMKMSAPVMVTIRVRRVCEARITGVPQRIDYTASSVDSIPLFPKLRLELCEMKCKSPTGAPSALVVQTRVALRTRHISFGCDRDASKCKKRPSVVDLLPAKAAWTSGLVSDEGAESVFHFDGTAGAVVPKELLAADTFASKPFTLQTQFRHHSIAHNDKHTKEHVICSADDHKMNRHHMALFIRNCRLILLLRKSFQDGDLNIFSPAEWRWKLPQVCDNEWHRYTINVQLPKVELFVDGAAFVSSSEARHSNPEVIDDWPLHAAQGINTTVAVGACYQGAEGRLRHGFRGDISSIEMSLGSVLTLPEIQCGTDCAERFLVPDERFLGAEQQIQSNAQLNEITVQGSNHSNIELLLQKIQYENDKDTPTIGRRNIQVMTTVSCPNKKAIRLPTIDTYIMVTKPSGPAHLTPPNVTQEPLVPAVPLTDQQRPLIVIQGNQNNLVSYPDIKDGVHFLQHITIAIYTDNQISSNLQELDSCSVNVFPNLNPDHEEITLRETADGPSTSSDIKAQMNRDGVELVGFDTIARYLRLLRSLVYINRKPAYYLNRVFKLSCSQLGDRFRSAEFTLTLTVLHPKPQEMVTPTLPPPTEKVKEVADKLAHLERDNTFPFAHALVHALGAEDEPQAKVTHSLRQHAASAHSTWLIVVICGAFVVLICGVGIARLRQAGSGGKGEEPVKCPRGPEQQLDWDDSALTITMNPMQQESLSDDSSDSENSDSDEEEVINGRYRNVSQLEWDNSTM